MLLGNLEETTKMEEKSVESKVDESQLAALKILYKRWDEIKARDGIPPIAVDRTNSYHGQYIRTLTDLDMVWKEIVALRKTMDWSQIMAKEGREHADGVLSVKGRNSTTGVEQELGRWGFYRIAVGSFTMIFGIRLVGWHSDCRSGIIVNTRMIDKGSHDLGSRNNHKYH
ncbi:uncharacterized protein EAF02_012158 [Botrytis sinoallii]|uniref:uncharacterized protein n=1 Tax=Botrytis sinoallii TaxID=1463999 RepID=UPI0018FFA5CE|nr:uncharacterized protein EAF02_012158 [Botrytis sinoallii]KAF7852759.1 hypothetical protein EAF02_012158 [Botrytis sinoallii]